jgi:hypothetical protein
MRKFLYMVDEPGLDIPQLEEIFFRVNQQSDAGIFASGQGRGGHISNERSEAGGASD